MNRYGSILETAMAECGVPGKGRLLASYSRRLARWEPRRLGTLGTYRRQAHHAVSAGCSSTEWDGEKPAIQILLPMRPLYKSGPNLRILYRLDCRPRAASWSGWSATSNRQISNFTPGN